MIESGTIDGAQDDELLRRTTERIKERLLRNIAWMVTHDLLTKQEVLEAVGADDADEDADQEREETVEDREGIAYTMPGPAPQHAGVDALTVDTDEFGRGQFDFKIRENE